MLCLHQQENKYSKGDKTTDYLANYERLFILWKIVSFKVTATLSNSHI